MKLLAMAAALTLTGAGCAMAFQEHRPSPCSTSRTLPRMDLAFLGAEAGAAIVGDVLRTGGAHPTAGGALIGTALTAAAVQAVSASKGFRWADECTGEHVAAAATK